MVSRGSLAAKESNVELTFECLLNIQCLLGTSLEIRDVALGLAESHGSFRRDHPLIFLHVNLVTNDNLFRLVSIEIPMPLQHEMVKRTRTGHSRRESFQDHAG